MKHYLPALISCLLFMAFTLPAPAQGERHYTCYRSAENIVADGRLDEPGWSLAEWTEDFADITGNPELKPRFRTRIKMLWDDKYLYLAAEIRETDIWATIHKRDAVIFKDNDFEIFIDPEGNGRNYYEIEVNALGTIWDLMLTKAYKEGGKPITRWNLDGLKTGIRIHGTLNDPFSPDTSWIVEMALPLSSLMHGKKPSSRPADGVQWRVNFSRVEWKTEVKGSAYFKKPDPNTGKDLPEDNWAWSPMEEVNMHIPGKWGRLEFSTENIRPGPLPFKDDKKRTGFRIWLWMGAHESWKPEQWDSVMTALSSAGISGVLTQADPATLVRMIPHAHMHGILVQKWFIAMMNNDTSLFRVHPDWFVINRNGKSCITDPAYVGYYRFFCPSNPEVHEYLKARLDEYLRIPGLDGIHLDYIRYPDVILPQALWSVYNIVQDREYAPYDYCYCKRCREKFHTLYGTDPNDMEHPDTNSGWRQFRCDQLTSLVKDLSDYCHMKGKKLSAAVFPGPTIAKQLVRQSWNEWPLDEVMPMLYQNFYYGSLAWIRKETAEGIRSMEWPGPFFSGLYIPALNPRELQSAIMKSIEGGAGGVCLFNYETMTPKHWAAINYLFRR